MTLEQRFDPTSIRPDIPITMTPAGPRPSGVPDADAYFAAITNSGDGVESIGPVGLRHYYDELIRSVSWSEDCAGVTTMHPRDACMLALYKLIANMKWRTISLAALVSQAPGDNEPPRPPAMTQHKLETVRLDHPDWDDTDIPVGNALISAPDEIMWTPSPDGFVRQPYLVDGTEDVFGEGTMLRYLGEYTDVPMRLVLWFAHKDIRRGFEARFCALLAAERKADQFHRRVIVPEYFGREATLRLVSSSKPDDPTSAQAQRWPFVATISAEIEQVELVQIPGRVVKVQTGLQVDGVES